MYFLFDDFRGIISRKEKEYGYHGGEFETSLMLYMYPELVSSLVAIGEIAAGVGIIFGGLLANKVGHLITRLSGGAVAVIMIGALLIAHKDWLVTQELFMSEQIFLLALGLYFAIKGNK